MMRLKLIVAVAALGFLAQGVLAQTQTEAPAPIQITQATEAATQERTLLRSTSDYYRLQPGDTVTINFRFTPEFNDEVVIGPDGRVMLKSAGEVRLAGLSLAEAQREVVRMSSTKLVNPEVSISLKDFERPHVIVGGDVQTPGRFELRKATTALQAILMAGGPKEDSAMGRVLVFRKLNSETAEVHVLQLGKFRAKDRAKNDMILQPDDMILVQHDNLSKIERYVKVANIGVYFDPLSRINF
ncbi:MAG TPA: polysaccharide biosynthesis/export family protein [Acidobacteriaceae bacterium]